MWAKTRPARAWAHSSRRLQVVPGGLGAAEQPGGVVGAVPADAEAVAVGRRRAQLGVLALDDQGVLGLVEQVLEQHG